MSGLRHTRWAWIALLVGSGAGCAPGTFDPPEGGVYVFDGAMIPRDGGAMDAARPDGGSDGDAPDVRVLDTGTDVSVISVDAPVCADTGAPTGTCVLRVPVGSFGPLNDACLPRCSAATAATYRACTSNSCRSAATRADRTSGVTYYVGSLRNASPLDCDACVAYQEMHCFSLVCQAEVDGYVDECIAGGTVSSCDYALLLLNSCLGSATPSEEAVLDACMGSHDGPEGCFPCGS